MSTHQLRLHAALWIAAAALASTLFPGFAAAELELVAFKGSEASEPLSVFRKLSRVPAAGGDIAGHAVAFDGSVRGAVRATGMFADDVTLGAETLALKGDAASTNYVFRKFLPPCMNRLGDVTWKARLSGAKGGIFRRGPGAVALTGDISDQGPLANFGRRPTVNDAGDVLFQAAFQNDSDASGLFLCPGSVGNCASQAGSLQTLAKTGDEIPDRSGRKICAFAASRGAHRARISNHGIAFAADTKADCANDSEIAFRGIFRLAFGGTLETLALVGEATSAEETIYAGIDGAVSINNQGVVAFKASSIGAIDAQGLYRCDSLSCPGFAADLVMQDGHIDAFGNEISRPSHLAITDADQFLFYARGRRPDGKRLHGVFALDTGTGVAISLAADGDTVPLADGGSGTARRVQPPGCVSTGTRVAFQTVVRSNAGGSVKAVYLADALNP